VLMATWPYVGSSLFRHLPEVLNSSRRFPWPMLVLYRGQEILDTKLPWHYVPYWVCVTTPLAILLLSLLSPFFIRQPSRNRPFVLVSIALMVNIILYYLTRPVIYDGIRHMLFLIPILSVIAALSLVDLYHRLTRPGLRLLVGLLLFLDFGSVAVALVRLHPYEYVYFNGLIGGLKGAEGRMEVDYYAASMREAVKRLGRYAASTPKGTVAVYAHGNPAQTRPFAGPNIRFVDDLSRADYFICSTKLNNHLKAGTHPVIFTVERERVPFAVIFKMR
jgi:hypothetical protein